MKRKSKQTEDVYYVVVHKNPDSRYTNGGKKWAVDGFTGNWNYTRAELHAKRCEYGEMGIPYEVIELSKVNKYVPSLLVIDEEDEIQEL